MAVLHHLRDKARYLSKIVIFSYPRAFDAPVRGSPSEYWHPVWCGKTRMVGLPDGEKNADDIFSYFNRILACDGQTDGRMDRHHTRRGINIDYNPTNRQVINNSQPSSEHRAQWDQPACSSAFLSRQHPSVSMATRGWKHPGLPSLPYSRQPDQTLTNINGWWTLSHTPRQGTATSHIQWQYSTATDWPAVYSDDTLMITANSCHNCYNAANITHSSLSPTTLPCQL